METTVFVVIAAYLVGVTVVGSVLARRSAGGSGWAVADGRMGLLLVAVGVAVRGSGASAPTMSLAMS